MSASSTVRDWISFALKVALGAITLWVAKEIVDVLQRVKALLPKIEEAVETEKPLSLKIGTVLDEVMPKVDTILEELIPILPKVDAILGDVKSDVGAVTPAFTAVKDAESSVEDFDAFASSF